MPDRLNEKLSRSSAVCYVGQVSRFSNICRLLRKTTAHPGAALRALGPMLLSGDWAALRERLSDREFPEYQRWLDEYDRTPELPQLSASPLFSVIVPTFRTPIEPLRECVESVRAQIYGNWELCIADDGSAQPALREFLEGVAHADPRIKLTFRPERGGISAASNSAVSLATGEWLAFLDHDDLLHPEALFWVAYEIGRHPQSVLVYTDEDKIDAKGRRFSPHFKPDFDPELLLTQNYLCHLLICRADVAKTLKGFREGYEGAQDWDLALRVAAHSGASGIRHIPRILYHWRENSTSTALSLVSKPGVLERQKRTVESCLAERGAFSASEAKVSIDTSRAQLRVSWEARDLVPVSVFVLDELAESDPVSFLEKLKARTEYPDYEIFIGGRRLVMEGNVTYLPPSRSLWEMFRVASTHAKGACFVVADSSSMPTEPGWLRRLVAQAMRPEISGVCGMVIDERGIVVERGILNSKNALVFPGRGARSSSWGYMRRGVVSHRASGCAASPLAIKAALALAAGELAAGDWNELRLNLSARLGEGILIVDPTIVFERAGTPRPVPTAVWGNEIDLYSPNLAADPAYRLLAFPPRSMTHCGPEAILNEY